MRRKIAAGNWKMNGTARDLGMIDALARLLPTHSPQVVLCPPAPLLFPAAQATSGGPIAIGAQDCHSAQAGAFTGDISAPMIADTGARFVILGHSERRQGHGERDADVCNKVDAAWKAGLTAIVCLGETLEDRDAGRTLDLIAEQLGGSLPDGATPETTVIAYEPIWAIGTGKIPTFDQIMEVHDFMRAELAKRFGADTAEGIALLYGGSVKADNAATIFEAANVDGALVGGASLTAEDFAPIVEALAHS